MRIGPIQATILIAIISFSLGSACSRDNGTEEGNRSEHPAGSRDTPLAVVEEPAPEKAEFPEPDYIPIQNALEAGLPWLAEQQGDDGRWPSTTGPDWETTGLVLLAFLGAGHTHKHRSFKGTVKAALKAFKSTQGDGGSFGGEKGTKRNLRAHAICTFALTEAYVLSNQSPLLQGPVEKAKGFLLANRKPGAGWGREPGSACDPVTTAWALSALRAARLSRVGAPKEPVREAIEWLRRKTDPETGRVEFSSKGKGEGPCRAASGHPLAPTAATLAARWIFIRGDEKPDPPMKKGLFLLRKNLPKWDDTGKGVDLEYWYFGTTAMYTVGKTHWEAWNPGRKEALFPHQVTEGKEAGSWPPTGPGAERMGRCWTTALALMTLEFYFIWGRVKEVK
ncbi:MAG: prenyltransferase/squalene oxidase repeat-containing protein [Planctomycetota bacterium]|jgi:hypothetical protein